MKKCTIVVTAAALILAVTLAAVAQQDNAARRQSLQRGREAQQKAMADLEANVAKLKAIQEQPAQTMQNREQFQNMSEEERAKLRETFTQRRQQQVEIMQALQNSVAILEGGRQLRTDHRQAMAALQAAKDLAVEEKAAKAADAIQKIMDEKQKKYEETLTALGMTVGTGEGQRGQGPREQGQRTPGQRGQRNQ
ncbi:MAG: hypothetical protein IH624_20210 [Phycisphaerae bacterium]|nr:hypothetical protein [Phycisphaerae bacterium]